MKIIKKFLMIGLLCNLSGCATNLLNELIVNDKYQPERNVGIALTDQLIAIGTAKQPIKGYEHALVIAGEKYSYLTLPDVNDSTPKDLFQQIFKQIDLNYVTISQSKEQAKQSNLYRNSSKKNTMYFVMEESENAKNTDLKTTISMHFNKPQHLMKRDEKKRLEYLNFTCHSDQQSVSCIRQIPLHLRLAQAVQNKNDLTHLFKQPIALTVEYDVNNHKALKKVGKIALYPLAITFDVITSPLQLIGLLSYNPSI